MILNNFGEIAHREWLRTSELRQNIEIDEFIVMPNHLHGILTIKEQDKICTGTRHRATTGASVEESRADSKTLEAFGKPTSNSIPTIIRSYKATVTKQINQITKQPGDKIWQRNYYERIIRNPRELVSVRAYIRNNPRNWWQDHSKR